MHSLEGTVAANKAAVLREYQTAIEDKNTELALRILRANPDIYFHRALTPEEVEGLLAASGE